ncbi:MAG TPA: hypothetical protein VII08_17575 [Myxococcales bacterium]
MLATLMAASLALAPEVEVLGGYLAGGSGDPKAIALSLRVGADFDDLVTVSGLLLGVAGNEGRYTSGAYAGRVDPSGMTAWAALMEGRLHTSGSEQLYLGGALGIGKLATWQCVDCTETAPLYGHPALTLHGSTGIRVMPPSWDGFTLGAQVAMTYWQGQEDPPNLASAQPWQTRAAPRLTWALLAAVGYRWP